MIFTDIFWGEAITRNLKLGRLNFTQFVSQDAKQTADHDLGIFFIAIDLANKMQELALPRTVKAEVLQQL